MANVKISDLPTASTPLTGAELVPVVQSGVTSQTTVDALALDPLATNAGSSLVGYLPSGTGAVATTVQTKLRETVSVMDFGAVGDGSTPDYTAFNNAITYCAANNKVLYVPKPSNYYNIESNLTISCVFSAGLYRVFGGAGTISFNAGTIETVYSKWFASDNPASTIFASKNVPYWVKLDTGVENQLVDNAPSATTYQTKTYVSGAGYDDQAKGVGAYRIDVSDSQEVVDDPTKAGILYGIVLTIDPKVSRGDIPNDDATGIIIQNEGTQKATDALYFGRGSAIGANLDWNTFIANDAWVDTGIAMQGYYQTAGIDLALGQFDSSAVPIRIPVDQYITAAKTFSQDAVAITTGTPGIINWPNNSFFDTQKIIPTGYQLLTSVTITGTAGQFSCSSTILNVNDKVRISGAFSAPGAGSITGYTDPKIYYIIATNGSTTFTLSASLGGASIATTAGNTTGLAFWSTDTLPTGLTAGTTYYITNRSGTGAGATFNLATTSGGSAISLTGSQAANHILVPQPYNFGLLKLESTNPSTTKLPPYTLKFGSAAYAFNVAPYSDNTQSIGIATNRWSVVYAGTGTINTSDAREKQDIVDLDAVEKRVAVALKGLVKKFKFKDAVEKKGNAARIHVGVIAQEVMSAFAAEGLDATKYGLLCYDEWEATDDAPAGNRYGVRYEELLAFIIAAL